jgi:hypothetical protein
MDQRPSDDQELFLPTDSNKPSASPSSQMAQTQQPRFYEAYHPDQSQTTPSAIPDVNIIPATPSSTRSDTVRSSATESKAMSGALPEVNESDELYDAPSSHSYASGSVPNSYVTQPSQDYGHQPEPHSSTSQQQPITPYTGESTHPPYQSEYHSPNEGYSQPAHPPDVQLNAAAGISAQQYAPGPPVAEHETATYRSDDGHSQPAYPPQSHDTVASGVAHQPYNPEKPVAEHQAATQPPPPPPTYDEYQASRVGEQPPPLPDQRPPIPEMSPARHAAHPAVHIDSDQDYALALQLQEEEEHAPPLPQRPSAAGPSATRTAGLSSNALSSEESDYALARRLQEEENETAPALPIRPRAFENTPSVDQFSPPPRRQATDFGQDNPSDPIHYTRDPHKLTAYLIPFPVPNLSKAPADAIPQRFMIYTPPPPPLKAPPEGVKEARTHKVQRKWQDEVRKAKLSEAKVTSWAGFRAKTTRGVSKAMNYTTTSNIDFLSRMAPPPDASARSRSPSTERPNPEATPGLHEEPTTAQPHETKKTIGVDTMIFVYPPSMNQTPDQMRTEFVNTVLRTKSKAMRDSVIATGLLPVSLAVDLVLIAVSGIFEVNAAWAYFNIKGAKTARSVSKRLSSSTTDTSTTIDPDKPEAELQKEDKLRLEFKPATRIDILSRYLQAECHKVEPKFFPAYATPPTES